MWRTVQALRAQRAAEQPGAKKRKRLRGDDEGASSAEAMSDSDDAVGLPFPSILICLHAWRALPTSCLPHATKQSFALPPAVSTCCYKHL